MAAVRLFSEISTQWLVGPCGVYGLNYLVLFHKLDRMNLSSAEYGQLEDDIRVMECAALKQMQKESRGK